MTAVKAATLAIVLGLFVLGVSVALELHAPSQLPPAQAAYYGNPAPKLPNVDAQSSASSLSSGDIGTQGIGETAAILAAELLLQPVYFNVYVPVALKQ